MRLADPFGLKSPDKGGLREWFKKLLPELLGESVNAQIALECANSITCAQARSQHYQLVYLQDACNRLVLNNPHVPHFSKKAAIGECLAACDELVKEKCKANPNACIPGGEFDG